jgi:hypothetical protein
MAKQNDHDRGSGTRTTQTDTSVPPTDARAQREVGKDPQLRKVHEVAGSDDELGRGNDVPLENGGARHRQQ